MIIQRWAAFAAALLGAITVQAAELPSQRGQTLKSKRTEAEDLQYRRQSGGADGERRVRPSQRLYVLAIQRRPTEVRAEPQALPVSAARR